MPLQSCSPSAAGALLCAGGPAAAAAQRQADSPNASRGAHPLYHHLCRLPAVCVFHHRSTCSPIKLSHEHNFFSVCQQQLRQESYSNMARSASQHVWLRSVSGCLGVCRQAPSLWRHTTTAACWCGQLQGRAQRRWPCTTQRLSRCGPQHVDRASIAQQHPCSSRVVTAV